MTIEDRRRARLAIRQMDRARNFPHGTCPASRHVAIMAETLATGQAYQMFDEEPEYCAESIASTVHSLWNARAKLRELGWTWTVKRGRIVWREVKS